MNAPKFDAKQCQKVRSQLDAYLGNELLVETTGEVVKHLESCAACATEVESRMRVRDALRRAIEKQVPPTRLSEAIHTRLRKNEPRYFWRTPATWAMALAALALVVIAGIAGQQWIKFQRGRQLVASILALGVRDHLHCAIRGHNYLDEGHLPEQLREKLGLQYAPLLPVVERKLSGYQVLEAHICDVPGSPRKYVHFIARGRGTIVSVILTKREGESLPEGKFLAVGVSGDIDLYKATLEGESVAGFETSAYFGFVVSNLGQDEMIRIAESLAPALRDALIGSIGTEKAAAAS